jgi:hypothetical protein
VIYCGAVEVQDRGSLHRHVVMFTDEALSHEEVQGLALAAGYGCVLDLQPLTNSRQVGRYLAKYVTKSSVDRAHVSWQTLDPETGVLKRIPATYRLWSSSRTWGVTMRQIRDVARAQARARARYLAELSEAMQLDGLAVAAGLAPAADLGPRPG